MNHWEANRADHPAACTCTRCNRVRTSRLRWGEKHAEEVPASPRPSPGKSRPRTTRAQHPGRTSRHGGAGYAAILIIGVFAVIAAIIFWEDLSRLVGAASEEYTQQQPVPVVGTPPVRGIGLPVVKIPDGPTPAAVVIEEQPTSTPETLLALVVPTPEVTPTFTAIPPTSTPEPTATATASPTFTPVHSSTPTFTAIPPTLTPSAAPTFTPEPTSTFTPQPTPTFTAIPPTITPIPPTVTPVPPLPTSTPPPHPDPTMRHVGEKRLMLHLINEVRAGAGLDTLGHGEQSRRPAPRPRRRWTTVSLVIGESTV